MSVIQGKQGKISQIKHFILNGHRLVIFYCRIYNTGRLFMQIYK